MFLNKNPQPQKVYVGMNVDIIQHGHLKVINEAAKQGEVIVGRLTDQAVGVSEVF